MSHVCHAVRCKTPCRPTLLMCPRHWRMVSPTTQARVLDNYRSGQCSDMRPSPEWINAALTAQAEVAKAEQIPLSIRMKVLLGETP